MIFGPGKSHGVLSKYVLFLRLVQLGTNPPSNSYVLEVLKAT